MASKFLCLLSLLNSPKIENCDFLKKKSVSNRCKYYPHIIVTFWQLYSLGGFVEKSFEATVPHAPRTVLTKAKEAHKILKSEMLQKVNKEKGGWSFDIVDKNLSLGLDAGPCTYLSEISFNGPQTDDRGNIP